MFRRSLTYVLALGALAAPFIPSVAHAGIRACNDIDVRASAKCELVTSGGCTAQCEPTRFRAACAGKLSAECDGECNIDATVDCSATCTADCNTKCQVNPGSFDCKGSCSASCDADCDAQCGSTGTSNTCSASCRANCSAKCDGQCSGTPPSAECSGKCEASCKGSCRAKASAKCQIDCQAKLEGKCTAELEGGCKARCTKPEGALFCDGQYVDTGDNLQECIDALRAALNIQVQGSASAQCNNGTCTGAAEGSASCTVSPRREPAPAAPIVPAVIVATAIAVTALRKNRRGPF
jgi:hypothetical protein